MKKLFVAATLLMTSLAWANPVDLVSTQVICSSAVPGKTAVLLTLEKGAGFMYVEDYNKDGAFAEDEYTVFNGSVASSSDNATLNSFLALLTDLETTPFATVQEIQSSYNADYSATFIYGFNLVGEAGTFGLFQVNEVATGNPVMYVPLGCQEHVQ